MVHNQIVKIGVHNVTTHLTECWLVMDPGTPVSMSTCSNLEVKTTVDPIQIETLVFVSGYISITIMSRLVESPL